MQSTIGKVIDILKKYLISTNFHYLSMNFKMSHREKKNRENYHPNRSLDHNM